MSKLPNAPLIEVIFELRWKITGQDELKKCQYLHGDLYSQIKDKYAYRESIIGPEIPMEVYINSPAHRFRVAQDAWPLVQTGPGLLTINTVDEKYIWVEYRNEILSVVEKFLSIYRFNDLEEITLNLQYVDFFKFDFDKENIYQYLDDNLHLGISQDFINRSSLPKNLSLGLNYEIDLGLLAILINRGKNALKGDGIVMQSSLGSRPIKPSIEVITSWLNESQEFCSQLFKDMTKGKLYNSFGSRG